MLRMETKQLQEKHLDLRHKWEALITSMMQRGLHDNYCLSFKSPEADVIVPIVTTLGGVTVPGAIPLMNAAT